MEQFLGFLFTFVGKNVYAERCTQHNSTTTKKEKEKEENY